MDESEAIAEGVGTSRPRWSAGPFKCPECGGRHFGRVIEDEHGVKIVTDVLGCHDEFKRGCKWRGTWPPDQWGKPFPPPTESSRTLMSPPWESFRIGDRVRAKCGGPVCIIENVRDPTVQPDNIVVSFYEPGHGFKNWCFPPEALEPATDFY